MAQWPRSSCWQWSNMGTVQYFLKKDVGKIVKDKGDRVYIEKGNIQKLSDVKYFTFEPHIAFPDSKYGYKKENIYYFDENGLMEL